MITSIFIQCFMIWNIGSIGAIVANQLRNPRLPHVFHHPGVLRGHNITVPCLTPAGRIEQNSELYAGDYILKYEWSDYIDLPLFGPRIKLNRRTGVLKVIDSRADDTGLYKCSILYHAAGTRSYIHKVVVYDWAIPQERFAIDIYEPNTTSGKTIIPNKIMRHILNKVRMLLKTMYGEIKWVKDAISVNGCTHNKFTGQESEFCYLLIDIKPTKKPQDKCTGPCNLQAQKDELKNVAVGLHNTLKELAKKDPIVKKYIRMDSFRSQRYLTCLEGFHLKENDHCLPCHPGQYNVSKESKCKPCAKGTYQEFYGKTHCVPCPDGKVTGHVGQTSSKSCHSASIGDTLRKAAEHYGEMLSGLLPGR